MKNGLSPLYIIPILGTCILAFAKANISIIQLSAFDIPSSIIFVLLISILTIVYMAKESEDINSKKEKLILDWRIILKEENSLENNNILKYIKNN